MEKKFNELILKGVLSSSEFKELEKLFGKIRSDRAHPFKSDHKKNIINTIIQIDNFFQETTNRLNQVNEEQSQQ